MSGHPRAPVILQAEPIRAAQELDPGRHADPMGTEGHSDPDAKYATVQTTPKADVSTRNTGWTNS
jgi:hypothetical protein